MAYNSKYTGGQVEKAIGTALSLITGTVEVTATADGHAHAEVVNVAPNSGGLKAFATVRRYDYGSAGIIIPIINYNLTPTGDIMRVHLYGDGVKRGSAYTVDYLLIKEAQDGDN